MNETASPHAARDTPLRQAMSGTNDSAMNGVSVPHNHLG
jgi:hypothetical protein